MRKHDKNQCMALIRTLRQVHDEIIKLIDRERPEDALSLLEQCQESAISVGTLIESKEGMGTEAVRILEDYCELIYNLYQELIQGKSVNVRPSFKKLKEVLLRTETSIREEIPTQIEAVFLPYKASMWDSLESVWEAADADPECTAYVIPIPYYDKDAAGRIAQEHYEGNIYPEHIPITNYRSYHFEERHPDMIFIHYPYDGVNYVTGIPHFFYSENLKKYTDCLVYIPYFIQEEPKLGQNNEKAMQEFYNVPAFIHSHHVVVQSEGVKKCCVDVLAEKNGEHTRIYWEQKILGLGSPKVEKVLKLQKEKLKLPESWENIIAKEDGSSKKVIFYNTTIAAFIKHEQMMLEKIREVFAFFEKNQDAFTLLWRPHPLMKETISSMCPQLLQEYEAIERVYREGGWGIYDDTASMEEAIAISDAYYGDMSSVVWLYEKTGKPIMIQVP